MKRVLGIIVFVALVSATVLAQRTTFTGTVLVYGSGMNTRTSTAPFTLTINGITSAGEAQRLLGVLQENGQSGLLTGINRSRDLGRFSIGGRVGRQLGAVVVDNAPDGRQRIRAIMDRWVGFGELWRSSRSTDYPFSYIELLVDRTGRGEGTFIQAAKIRWKNNKGQNEVEIEDFGTLPGRLMGVVMRGNRLQ